MIEPTSPKFRVLKPNKLLPPEPVLKHNKEKILRQRMKNPFIRFFVTFFGEGY